MAVHILKANQRKQIKVSRRFLSILSIGGSVSLDSPEFDLAPIKIKSNYQLDLDGITEVYLENNEPFDNPVEVQDAGIRITMSGGGGVTIENTPSIRRIEEPITVQATSTVENGTINILSNDVLLPLNITTLQAGQSAQIVAPRNAVGRKITLQVISNPTAAAPVSVIHVGHNSSIDNSKGAVLSGSIDAIGSAEFATTSAIFVHNASASEAKICGIEQYSTKSIGA